MKLFATSDIHGNKEIESKLKDVAQDTDLVVICGDIGGKGHPHSSLMEFSKYQLQEAQGFFHTLDTLPVPSRFILGNDDWFDCDNSHYLKQPEMISANLFIPFEYVAITPFNTNREANENKLEYELHKLKADHDSIVVAHTPPYGAGDVLYRGDRCGSIAVRRWIQKVQPKMWLCGHIHEDYSVSMIGKTYVFNCACWNEDGMLRGWYIDTDTMEFEKVRL